MRATTARLFEELKQVTADLCYSTEAEYPIEPFVWEFAEKGELTLDKLWQFEGFLQQVKIDQVFPQNLKFHQNNLWDEMQVEDRKQLELIEFLRSRCQSLEVYLAQKDDGPDDVATEFEEFPLILAETATGEWIGIAPEATTDFETRLSAERLGVDYNPLLEQQFWWSAFSYKERLPPHNRADFYVRFDLESLLRSLEIPLSADLETSLTIKEFLVKLKQADSLLPIATRHTEQVSAVTLSLATEIKKRLIGIKLFTRQFCEPHQPVERFVMRIASTKELLICDLVDAMGFARVCQFIQFSQEAEGYDDPEDEERYTSLEPLDQLLTSNLSNLREYVVGCASVFYLYDVGQTLDGDWLGVSTAAVWT